MHALAARPEPCPSPCPSISLCLPPSQVLAKVRGLTLDDSKVADRERARYAATSGPPAPLPIRLIYGSLCWMLDVLYAGRPIQRFWILETVARMPYFVYISMVGGMQPPPRTGGGAPAAC